MKPRERVAAALDHIELDRCPFQATFTPEFAVRLRGDLQLEGDRVHNPHGGGNPYDLEIALGEDLLLTSSAGSSSASIWASTSRRSSRSSWSARSASSPSASSSAHSRARRRRRRSPAR
jgi:hypothetical protein